MIKKVKYMRADPAGNLTGFIIGDIPASLRKKVSE